MIYGRAQGSVLNRIRILTSRKAQPLAKSTFLSTNTTEVNDKSVLINDQQERNNANKQITLKSLSDLTKFRLSQYNTLASYSMYLYYAPTFMPYESLLFL